MKLFLHYFRTEFLADHKLVATLLVTVLLWIFAALSLPNSSSAWLSVTLPKLCFAAIFVWYTTLAALSGFRDSPRREDHHLSTRPVKRRQVFLAKGAHIVLVSLLPVAGQFIISKGLGLEFSFLAHTMIVVLWGLCALFLGAFVRMTAGHVMKWGVFGTVMIVLLNFIPSSVPALGLYPKEIGEITLLLVALIVLVLLFRLTEKRTQKLTTWCTLIISIAFATLFATSLIRDREHTVTKESKIQTALEERKEMSIGLIGLPGRKLKVIPYFQSYVQGSPRTLYVEPRDLVITNSSGNILDLSEKETTRHHNYHHDHTTMVLTPFSAFLKSEMLDGLMEGRYTPDTPVPNATSITVVIPEDFAPNDQEITISYTPQVRLKELTYLGDIPYEQGATLQSKGFAMTHVRTEVLPVENRNHGNKEIELALHWASSDESDVYFLYSNPNGEIDWINRERPRNNSVNFTGHSIAQKSPFYFQNATESLKETEAYPEGAKLKVFQSQEHGSQSLARVSKTITPWKLFGSARPKIQHPSFTLRTTTDRDLGEAPALQGNEVLGYLKQLKPLNYSEIRDSAVIQSTLNHLARESSGELLDYLSSGIRSRSVTDFIVRSLTKHAPESIKEKAIRSLPEEPLLIDLVIKRGWGPEVKEQVLDLAPSLLTSNAYLIRKALIYYNDRTSLDFLLQDFEKKQSLEAYMALLASEEHRDRAQAIYSENEEKLVNKLKRLRGPEELSQSEMVLYLKTGSIKVLREFCRVCTRQNTPVGGSELYVMREALLWNDYVIPSHHSGKEGKRICDLVENSPDSQLTYDAERQRIILPEPSIQ